MTPFDNTNLNRFLKMYEKVGRYRLNPGLFTKHQQPMSPYADELYIEKTQLRRVAAWQIGPNDPVSGALGGIDNPIIPSDVEDPPVLETLEMLFNMKSK